MLCNHCKTNVPEQAKFCPHCGKALATNPVVAASRSTPPPLPRQGGGVFPPSEWEPFLSGLAGEFLNMRRVGADRFEFSGERKIKALFSRTTLRYNAVALIDSSRHWLQWWEKFSESSFGIKPEDFGGSVVTSSQKGAGLKVHKAVVTPGATYSYTYGELREAVETQAKQLGYSFELLLSKPE